MCAAREALYERAARRVAAAAATAIAARGRFAVALAGGSTPRPLYERLADAPHREAVEWQRVEVFWGDERCVPPDHPDSNARLAREALLDRVPVRPGHVHPMPGESEDREAAARIYEAEMVEALGAGSGRLARLDLALLGLGAEGHTASLFPDSPALAAGERLVVAVLADREPVPPPGHDRLTLTFPALNAAREVLFLVAGADKAAAVAAALEGPRDPARCPAQGVAPDPGRAAWLIDAEAASRLTGLRSGRLDGP